MTWEDLSNYRSLLSEIEETKWTAQRTEIRRQSEDSDLARLVSERRLAQCVARLRELETKKEAIEDAVYSLPSKERRVIVLHFFEGLTWQAVAKQVNYDEFTVRVHIARRAFARLFGP